MRTNFWSLFRVNADNSIEPVRLLRIGGVQVGPGVKFNPGVSFSGIDLSKYVGHDIETEEEAGTHIMIVRGIY